MNIKSEDLLLAMQYIEKHCKGEKVFIHISDAEQHIYFSSFNHSNEKVSLKVPAETMQTPVKIQVTRNLGEEL